MIIGQVEASHLGHRHGHRSGGFKRAGQLQGLAGLRLLQLGLGDGLLAQHAFDFFHQLHERLLGFVGLHRRGDDEGPLGARAGKAGAGAVAPVLVLAQVHVDARGEGAAENVVHRLDGDFARLFHRRRQFASEDDGLGRAGPVDEINAGRGGGAGQERDGARGEGGTGFPVAEKPLQLGRDLRERRVAHHDHCGVVRAHPSVVKLAQIGGRDLRHARFRARAGQRITVRMARTVEQRRKHAEGHAVRLRLFPGDAGEGLLLQTLEVRFGEGWVQRHIGINLQRRVELALQRVERDVAHVEVRAAPDARAESGQFIADFERTPFLCAFVQHPHREPGQAGGGSVGGESRLEQ